MVYCRLISRNGRADAIYAFGSYESDMTGRIVFYSDGKLPKVEKQPENGSVSNLWIRKLVLKYMDSLSRGDFKEKMAYEC